MDAAAPASHVTTWRRRGWRGGRSHERPLGGSLPAVRHLGLALGALGKVALEGGALLLVDGVDRKGADQAVDVGAHACTPRVSLRRIRPSRIRVLAVPRG